MLMALAGLLGLLLQSPAQAAATYAVEPARSSVVVHVGKSGVFKFAGHTHEVLASRISGEVVAVPEDLSRSSVKLAFEAASLQVSEKDEPAGDAPKVQALMEGPKVLDVGRHPSIAFASTAVSGRAAGSGIYQLEVSGDLTLHGVTRPISLPVRVELQQDGLKASGRLSLKQTAFGISPVSVGGVVNVKDELAIDFEIVASRRR